MALKLISLTLGVCVAADGQISADFDKACQAGQQDCVDNSDDMYLIQKNVEVHASAIQAKEKANKSHATKNKKDVEKDDNPDEDDIDKSKLHRLYACNQTNDCNDHFKTTGSWFCESNLCQACPIGYQHVPGHTKGPRAGIFGKQPDSVIKSDNPKFDCAGACDQHHDCHAFEFNEDDKECYLSAKRKPLSKFPGLADVTWCEKLPNCTFAWPWDYHNDTASIEKNAWTAWNTVHRCWFPWTMWCVISWLIWSILAILVWKLFFSEEPDIYEDPEDPLKSFEEGHFDCMRRPKICICAFCCPAVQWADTMHLAGFCHMSNAILIYLILAFFNGWFTIPWYNSDHDVEDSGRYETTTASFWNGTGWFPTGLYTSILMTVFRQKLRSRLGRYADSAPSWFFDFMYACCCPCCAIAQEAMVVRYSFQAGRKEPAGIQGTPGYKVTSGRVAMPSTGNIRPTSRTVLR